MTFQPALPTDLTLPEGFDLSLLADYEGSFTQTDDGTITVAPGAASEVAAIIEDHKPFSIALSREQADALARNRTFQSHNILGEARIDWEGLRVTGASRIRGTIEQVVAEVRRAVEASNSIGGLDRADAERVINTLRRHQDLSELDADLRVALGLSDPEFEAEITVRFRRQEQPGPGAVRDYLIAALEYYSEREQRPCQTSGEDFEDWFVDAWVSDVHPHGGD